MTPTPLIVPIDVAALCVGDPDVAAGASALMPTADFSLLPYTEGGVAHNRGPYTSANVLSAAAPFEGAAPLRKGIHLHFALPDGLTHAVQTDTGGPVQFPAAPNRWLVTRIVAAQDGDAQITSWVVESDRLSPDPVAAPGLGHPTVPLQPEPGRQPFRYIGRAFPAAEWTEQAGAVERLAPLAAPGYGEPTFAALYSNASTVFGFHDDPGDLEGYDPGNATISYHVAGWYGAVADPLAAGTVDPEENRFDWRFTAGDPVDTTICSGLVDGIAWDPASEYLAATPAAMTAAIAGSVPEGLSALIAELMRPAWGQGADAAEGVLNALQFGLLTHEGGVDSIEAFEEKVHAAGFGNVSGGHIWAIEPEAAGEDVGDEITLPEPLAAYLNELNVIQLQRNALDLELQARRWQLFADWHKYLQVAYVPDSVPPALRDQLAAVRAYLEVEVAAITAITGGDGRIADLDGQVAGAQARIEQLLPAGTTLVSHIVAPRFHHPTNPVVMLYGDDVTPTSRYGDDGAGYPEGKLPCRRAGELVTAIELPPGPGNPAYTVTAAELPALPTQPPVPALGDLLQDLMREAILEGPGLASIVAKALAAQGGEGNPAIMNFGATVAALSGKFAGAPARVGTEPAAPYLTEWQGTPWLPFLLQYEVALQPLQRIDRDADGAPYPPTLIGDQFRLVPDGIDFDFTGALPQTEPQTYRGTAVLTPGAATVEFAAEIDRWINAIGKPKDVVEQIIEQVEALPILAQSLGGLIEAMLMRELTLQMPVADPLASLPDREFVNAVAVAVADQNLMSPLPQVSFNPLRAGLLSITRLRLIDVFGRFRDYDDAQVAVAKGMAPPATLGTPAGSAFLYPRITQPARLMFRWLAAFDDDVETNSHPASSPILGWIVPNHVDRSILLYDASGAAIGELGLSGDGRSVLWTVAPGGALPPGTPLADAVARVNPHLRELATALWNGGDASFLRPFLNAVDRALATALPARFREDANAAVLAGQPLALARASLGLDVAGPAAADESWTSFTGQVLSGDPADDAGLTGVEFPVVLGSLVQLDDTLVGYWKDAAGATDWSAFYAPAAAESAGGVQPPRQDAITLTATGAAETLTLLLDPRGTVHATSGILPVQSIAIPPDQYGPALRSLALTFATAPVLSGSNAGGVSMAQPKIVEGEWSWVYDSGGAWATQPLSDAPVHATLDYTPQQIAEGWLALTRGGQSR